jgi:hypothetical protein
MRRPQKESPISPHPSTCDTAVESALRTERKLATSLFRWLYYVSLVFVVVRLYRADDRHVDHQRFIPAMVLARIFTPCNEIMTIQISFYARQ